jgi:hypothetical protein
MARRAGRGSNQTRVSADRRIDEPEDHPTAIPAQTSINSSSPIRYYRQISGGAATNPGTSIKHRSLRAAAEQNSLRLPFLRGIPSPAFCPASAVAHQGSDSDIQFHPMQIQTVETPSLVLRGHRRPTQELQLSPVR